MREGPVAELRPGRLMLAILLALAACGRGDDAGRAASAEEDRQLNEAAASLDANGSAAIRDDAP